MSVYFMNHVKSTATRDGIFADDYLSPTAHTPEGRLLIAVIERVFLDACIHRRAIINYMRGIPMVDAFYDRRQQSEHAKYLNHCRELGICDVWVFSDEYFPVSIRYACEWLAEEPAEMLRRLRQVYVSIRDAAVWKTYKARVQG